MKQLSALITRNLKIYLRDRSAVFFSLLAMFIVILLMIVFLGDMNIKTITNMLDELNIGDLGTNKKNAENLILMWTISGVVSINAVTITLSSLTTMINDTAQNRIQSFYTAPISKTKIALGYLGAAWISSIIICVITLLIGEVYAVSQGSQMFSSMDHIKLIGMIFINSFTYSCIMYFIAMLVKSEGAWSSINTIIGTLVGFLGGIYIPLAALPNEIVSFLKCLPVLHGTSMFRSVITNDMLNNTFNGVPSEIVDQYKEAMGISLKIGDTTINPIMQIAFLLICGIIFIVLSAVIMNKSRKQDR